MHFAAGAPAGTLQDIAAVSGVRVRRAQQPLLAHTPPKSALSKHPAALDCHVCRLEEKQSIFPKLLLYP